MSRTAHLRALLLAHAPRDPEEAQHRERMLALTDAGDLTLGRGHYAPGHFTASAFVLSPDLRSVLLIFHGKLARWLQPGGHVEESDEDLLAAARREVAEELGVTGLKTLRDGPFDLDVHVIPARKSEPAHEHFDVRFAFQVASLDFQAGDDAVEGRWLGLDEVREAASDRSVMRAIEKLKAELHGLV